MTLWGGGGDGALAGGPCVGRGARQPGHVGVLWGAAEGTFLPRSDGNRCLKRCLSAILGVSAAARLCPPPTFQQATGLCEPARNPECQLRGLLSPPPPGLEEAGGGACRGQKPACLTVKLCRQLNYCSLAKGQRLQPQTRPEMPFAPGRVARLGGRAGQAFGAFCTCSPGWQCVCVWVSQPLLPTAWS